MYQISDSIFLVLLYAPFSFVITCSKLYDFSHSLQLFNNKFQEKKIKIGLYRFVHVWFSGSSKTTTKKIPKQNKPGSHMTFNPIKHMNNIKVFNINIVDITIYYKYISHSTRKQHSNQGFYFITLNFPLSDFIAFCQYQFFPLVIDRDHSNIRSFQSLFSVFEVYLRLFLGLDMF